MAMKVVHTPIIRPNGERSRNLIVLLGRPLFDDFQFVAK